MPAAHLDALAAAGLYGLPVARRFGGLGADAATVGRVVEELAGGCLTTAFVWLQHQGVARRLAEARPEVRDRWVGRLCRGEVRAGAAIAGIRPGTEPLRVHRDGEGWRLVGAAPWVTGWGRIDVVHVAALDEEGGVVWLLVDAAAADTLRTERQELVAVQASGTVTAVFEGHAVPGDRWTARTTYADWQAGDAASLRGNGSLALGLASRCARLLGSAQLLDEVSQVRSRLDAAATTGMPAARAAAAELAWRVSALLLVAHGSRSVLRDQHPQRFAREAMFLLVFGSRPPIKQELARLLAARRWRGESPPA
ncbi:MAG: hypothetical protein QOI54_2418 [Actinomycetota bacterium]|nr:hypothetical protein [Actinomycetota bacterium]